MEIVIINYHAGNLRNVQKAFEHLGYEAKISSRAVDINRADVLILPGVGSFKDTATLLKPYETDLRGFLMSGKPFLGICVGLQYLFEESNENGNYKGLGFFKENRWLVNPYNKINGGPCSDGSELFTNALAKEYFKKKYKYIVSRYGFSSHIAAWE